MSDESDGNAGWEEVPLEGSIRQARIFLTKKRRSENQEQLVSEREEAAERESLEALRLKSQALKAPADIFPAPEVPPTVSDTPPENSAPTQPPEAVPDEAARNMAIARIVQQIQEARSDPIKFMEFAMRTPDGRPIELAWFHREWLEAMRDNKRVLIEAPRGHGKCQPGSSTVLCANGERVRIDSLTTPREVVAYDTKRRKFTTARTLPVQRNGVKRVLEIEDVTGRKTEVTEEHPFLKFSGWTPAKQLKVGDRIALPAELPALGRRKFDKDLAWLTGLLLGDGCLQDLCTSVTSGDRLVLAEVDRVARSGGWNPKKRRNSPRSWTVVLGGGGKGRKGFGGARTIYARTGLKSGTAHHKRVPAQVFSYTDEAIAEFVAGLVDSDGHVNALRGGSVEVYAVNKALLADVQHLLLRLGVVATLDPKRGRYKGRLHASWRLVIRSAHVARFAELVRLRGRRGKVLNKIKGNPFRDVLVPQEWRDRLETTPHWLRTHKSLRIDNHYETTVEKACRVAEALGDKELLKDLQAPLHWTKIVAVRSKGYQETWALEVEGLHNYITEDFVTHNTSITIGFALWLLGTNPNLRVKIICQNENRAKERLYEFRVNLETNPAVKLVFPNLKPADDAEWTKTKLYVERPAKTRDPSLEATGITTSVTGGRMDVLICDDVCDLRNSVLYPSLRETVKTKFFGELVPTLETNGKIIYIATPYHTADLTASLKKNPEWLYKHYQVGDKEDPFKPLWPAKWTRELLVKQRSEIGSVEFDRAYRCTALTGNTVPFKSDWLQYYDAQLLGDPNELICIIGYDLAISKKASADYFASVVLLYDPNRHYVFVVDAYQSKLSFMEQGMRVVHDAIKWNPDKILIEKVGLGGGLENFLQEKAPIQLPLVPYYPKGDKEFRLKQITPLFEDQRGFFHPVMDPLKNEFIGDRGDLVSQLLEFPLGVHDDLVDALITACNGLAEFRMGGDEVDWIEGDGTRVRLSIVG